jgi:2-oxo-3-hexenedioate decarboxylase
MPTLDSASLALQLRTAWSERTEVPTPTSQNEAFDIAAAYATEAELFRLRVAEGRVSAGRKIGFANKAMWRILKLDTLVWAHMYDDTVHYADGAHEFSLSPCYQPRIEPEIVVKLSNSLTAGLPAEAVLSAVEWIALGFEIIDCPYPQWQFQPADFVAAYGLHRALLVGPQLPADIAAVPELVAGLASCKIRLLKNDELVEEGAGKNSLRSPALCLAELAAATIARGEPLEPGELVSTGTLTMAHNIATGESWRAEVVGLPLEPVLARFI